MTKRKTPRATKSAAAWEAARIAFEAGGGSIAEVAATLGVATSTVRRRARREGWTGYPPRNADRSPLMTEGPPPAAIGRDAARLGDMEALLDAEIAVLQRRLSPSVASTSADDERRARALSGLIRVFEKVMEMKNTLLEQNRAAERKDDADGAKRADDVRAEIQRRLDRILADEGLAELAAKPSADGA
ncbi:MAG: hypothetical protein AAFR11_07590 [Pseudomonadota bacterium]